MESESVQHGESRRKIEGKLKELNTAVQGLTGDANDDNSLFRIIHNPGWTTIADIALLSESLEAALATTRALGAVQKQAQEVIGQRV